MSTNVKQDSSKQYLELLTHQLQNDSLLSVKRLINALHPAEIANLLEALHFDKRVIVWKLVDSVLAGEVLVELNDEVRIGLIEATDTLDLISAVETLEPDELADLLHDIPAVALDKVLTSMGKQDRDRLESVLHYDDDTAGGLMSLDTITVRADVALDVVLRYLRLRGEMPALTDNLIVVDRNDSLQGVLPLSALLTNDPDTVVGKLMDTDIRGIPVQLSAAEVALLFEQRNLISAPVIQVDGKLLGRITIDDVVDVIRDEADHSIMSMAGLDEEQDMFAPVVLSAQRRALWLGVNLFTAFLASWVIGWYEGTLEQIVALAVLMPIVASMGGVAGSQTLTLVIRGLALRQISRANAYELVKRELYIGVLNGIFWALVVAVIAGVWFHSAGLGILLGGAMIINLFCAALAGALIPLSLQKLRIDPALAGGVMLTTVTDVIGFMAFLGLASFFLV